MSYSSASVYGFHERLGVEAVWLPKVPQLLPGCPLIDVTKDARYQPLGVDFFVERPDSWNTGLEFKFDTYKSGNFAFEWVSQDRPSSANAPAMKDGWMVTCQSGWLLYTFITTGDMFALDMGVLRQWLAQNYHRFGSTSVANKTYFSYCSLVPMIALCRELPKEAWHWLNIRARVPGHEFERSLLAPAWIQKQETSVSDLVHVLQTGTRRSQPLALDWPAYGRLHEHLWNNNRLYERHIQPDDRRKVTLRCLPTLQPALAAHYA